MNDAVQVEVNQQTLEEWYKLKNELDEIKEKELDLRNRIYKHFFIVKDEHNVEILPKEGTNNFDLDDGFVLKAQRVVNRSVDQGSLGALKQEQLELQKKISDGEPLSDEEMERWLKLKGIVFDNVIEMKPQLRIKNYRELTDSQRALFDTALVIKEGTPQLDIVKPKRRT